MRDLFSTIPQWVHRFLPVRLRRDSDQQQPRERDPIEVAVWHRDRHAAAQVVADYAQAALTDAYGDRYDVAVWTVATLWP